MTDEIRFDDIAPVEVPVTLGDQRYVLREASGEAAERYQAAVLRGARLADGKVVGMDLSGVESLLVSLCLVDHEGKPVPLSQVKSWPARIQKALFEKAMDISGLREQETEEQLARRIADDQKRLAELRNGDGLGKGSPTGTPVGSD